MGAGKLKSKMIWYCDVCGAHREEPTTGNWDIDRAAWTEAREDGWSFEKLRGKLPGSRPIQQLLARLNQRSALPAFPRVPHFEF